MNINTHTHTYMNTLGYSKYYINVTKKRGSNRTAIIADKQIRTHRIDNVLLSLLFYTFDTAPISFALQLQLVSVLFVWLGKMLSNKKPDTPFFPWQNNISIKLQNERKLQH